MERILGILLIALSATAFGAMPLFAHYVYAAGVDPISLLFLRFSIATVLMMLWMLFKGIPFPQGKTLVALILLGSIGYGGVSLSYFSALTMIPAGLVATLLYLYPALVTVLSAVALKEAITKRKLCALLFASLGTLLVIGWQTGSNTLGILLGISAAIFYCFYIVIGSKVTKEVNVIASSTIVMGAAAMAFGGLLFQEGLNLPTNIPGWGGLIALILFSSVVAIISFFAGLKRIGPVNASMLSTLEPVTTILLGIIFLQESITALQTAGGLLVLGSALLLAKAEPEEMDRSLSNC